MANQEPQRALVTGASSGIGKQIAQRLAARGVALVITARRQTELEELATELRKQVDVTVVACDLATPRAASSLWQAATASGPLDILINNAGFGYFRRFDDQDATIERDQQLLQLNVTSVIELAKHFVTQPAAPTTRYMLNVASIAAYQAVPHMALYAASKALVRNFSEALHDECKANKIVVTCLCPGGTQTAFHAAAGAGDYGAIANASMKSADEVAAIGLQAMWRGKRTVVPGVANKFSTFGVRLVPRRFASAVASWVLGAPKRERLPAR